MADAEEDKRRFRAVFGAWTTGVAVITGQDERGPAGMTANAVCSLSLDPLLVLVCFDNGARTLPVIRNAGRFGVNVLGARQESLANAFASKASHRATFDDAGWKPVHHGVPILDGVLAWIACDLMQLTPGGDHTIGIGAVKAMDLASEGQPLIWHHGRYLPLP